MTKIYELPDEKRLIADVDETHHTATISIYALDNLVEAVNKTGHWITQWNVAHQKEYYYCSECREEFSYDGETGIKMNDYNFCPNCGSYNGVRETESEE